jgi:hypothetical protein
MFLVIIVIKTYKLSNPMIYYFLYFVFFCFFFVIEVTFEMIILEIKKVKEKIRSSDFVLDVAV